MCIRDRSYIGANTVKIVKATDAGNSAKRYKFTNKILYVIRLEFDYGPKVDIIVLDCTVPFGIERFDFNFCKVYFDGYGVQALDWNSVINKSSVDTDSSKQLSPFQAYAENIDRIEKYSKRGFIIMAQDVLGYWNCLLYTSRCV